MLYPKNIEEKLGFDKIRLMLEEKCSGPVGKSYVSKMRFSDKPDLVVRLLEQTREFLKILGSGEEFPRSNYLDIGPSLQKAAVPGTYLLEEEAYDLKRALTTIIACLEFFVGDKIAEYPELSALSEQVQFDFGILASIEAVIDERGKVKDNASPELSRIRSKIRSEEDRLRSVMEQLIRSLRSQGIAKDGINPTIRDGRMVVPVPAEHKRRVKGLVHDVSATGQTVYIEPEEILHINNEIRELELQERYEIVKILSRLTDQIRPSCENLLKANRFLGMLDFIKAKAILASELEAAMPAIEASPYVEWYHAQHPLLLLSHRKQGKKVVAQNLRLDVEKRILLISGPNAGGKSVTLKTVGLIQYMFQCGMLPTVMETSKMGFFKNIFLDIGDQQSLEDDLSTYSSHLNNMKAFMQHANEKSLCLIDEFGAGTEPRLGGAIAEAILEKLNQKQTFGVITTHYANLKFYANKTPGIYNGAMRYDVEHLQPLYQLDAGQPGSSFALEIAEKIGLPPKVVEAARQKIGTKEVSIERLLNQLEQEKKALEDRNRELVRSEKELEKLKTQYQALKNYYEQNKRQMLEEARTEAAKLLSEANQRIERTIREIKENKAEKKATKAVRKELDAFKKEVNQPALQPEMEEEAPAENVGDEQEVEVIGGAIGIGDFVQIKGQQTVGEVVEMGKKDAIVVMGELRTKIKLSRLQKVSRKNYKKQQKASVRINQGMDINVKMAGFSPKIDLRGKRAEEALALIDDYLDEAIMLNQQNLTIVHGKGDGILRQLIREKLRKVKEVVSMEDEHADRGGPGVTLVKLS